MDLIKLAAIFASILLVLRFKKPLYAAILIGALCTALLYKIPPGAVAVVSGKALISPTTISLVLAFYTITFLQRMLEHRGHIMLAEQSLSGLFNSRRVNAMIAPFIIGLLPSVAAVVIAAPIVDNAGGSYISLEDKTFITSYFRHISESFLPTYSSIILALKLSGVDMTAFVLAMLPMVAVLFALGYALYVRKIPVETGVPDSKDKKKDLQNLFFSLWTIGLTILIILILKWQVYYAVTFVILLSFVANRFTIKEILPMFVSAYEAKLMVNAVVIMVFKDILAYTGIISRLPDIFSGLPIPPVVIFSLIFLLGTLVAGSQAIIAIGIPLAFAAIPSGGVVLLVLLMCMTYIAMQISPAHVCLAVVIEVFDTSFFDLVKRTMPVMLAFLVIATAYTYILSIIL
jgi:hypothetical protein